MSTDNYQPPQWLIDRVKDALSMASLVDDDYTDHQISRLETEIAELQQRANLLKSQKESNAAARKEMQEWLDKYNPSTHDKQATH